ncbi:modifier of mdg4-like isoform X3 [Anopheles ziemanni]|uniref:modifier of mdg4-like isoform X7 n=1 Tax=Anopheles coustani TaxID=139045 RepID=UPI0026584C28|nr:modifier of mdg4-like isoform X7 [Anopheles coustani]XP_058170961.1 modifier of mdg4-like isoform X3 [Anopheles ziemanni]
MADDEQFSLCWNNFNTNLSAGFHESLLRGDLVDVTLAAEGQLVKAHRLILSVCSPYFRKMLTQVPATQHAFIFLKDVSHSALKDLIQFMYCGEVNVKQDALPAFISTAEALQIKGLTETGDSAPAQQSPAKEVIAAPPATISVPIATATGGSPRTKVQRTRVHSYKLESEESGDDKVQIQAGSSHHVTAQQVQQQTQHTTTQKRTLQQRTVIPIQPSKRTKLSVASVEALEAPEATPQVQTVQIVKQVLEPDYVEIPIESINAKAEPEYADETGEIETVETEAEQEHTLTEHEQSVEQEQADDDGNYVEDEYAEMGKFEESYFTEGEDAKAGASGFGDSYTSDGGTGTEQSAQAKQRKWRYSRDQPEPKITVMFRKTDQPGQTLLRRKKIDTGDGVPSKVYHLTTTPVSKDNYDRMETASRNKGTLAGPSSIPPTRQVEPNVDTVKMRDNTRPNACDIVKQLSNGHTLLNLVRKRVRGFCVYCIQRNPDPNYKKNLMKIITYCSACASSQWMCEGCFDDRHNVQQ